ncbi:MAG: hypothetical protein ACQESP_11865 [Candidatus Muiribacteriota bacterium]
MFFKKKFNNKKFRLLHSIQKKNIKSILLLQNVNEKNNNTREKQFINLYTSIRNNYHHLIDNDTSPSKNWFSDISMAYMNLSTLTYNFAFFLDYDMFSNATLIKYLKCLKDLMEIYETVVFHILDHPNLARENFGKREIFQKKVAQTIYEINSKDKNPSVFSFINLIEIELNKIETALKKIIY